MLVLPLLLTRMSTGEIALWYLFSSILVLHNLLDFGFSQTFIRVIAYAMGGAENLRAVNERPSLEHPVKPNWSMIDKIWSTIRSIYLRTTGVSVLLLAIIGSFALQRPIAATGNEATAWISWSVIVATSGLTFWGAMYGTFLQGVDQIALLRRWEALTSLGAIVTSFLVLYAGGRLLELVLVNQSWAAVAVLRNRHLCRTVENGIMRTFRGSKVYDEVFQAVWPSAWRSGLGIAMSYGLVHATGIVYAQFGSVMDLASYMVALRIVQSVSSFSQAPFYTRIPLLARHHFDGNTREKVQVAERGMRISYWAFVLGFICAGLLANPLMKAIGSKASFVDPALWCLMGGALFAERFGAMHIQLYSITNRIIWHIANGISGVITLFVVLLAIDQFGVYSFPLGLLAGYLGFYCWYSAAHSYKEYRLKLVVFESKTSLVPLLVLLVYFAVTLTFGYLG